MKVVFTLNTPSIIKKADGSPVGFQTIFAEYPADELEEIMTDMLSRDFLLMHEFYVRQKVDKSGRWLEDRGLIIVNTNMIIKVKPYMETET